MPHPIWPLFDLRIRTPHLTLRVVREDEFSLIAEVARDISDRLGVFMVKWADLPEPEFSRGIAQFNWRTRADWAPDDWLLPLGVFEGDVLVGQQDINAKDFGVLRQVNTGSWLGRAHQGRGIGKEMRAAVLHLGFAGLGAEAAASSARDGNEASLGVSNALGYRRNGTDRSVWSDGEIDVDHRLLLDRATWEQHRRDDIEIDGLEACLPMFGV